MNKILGILLLAIVVIGCGPKMAKQETMDALMEARAALEAAQSRIAELEGEMDALKTRKAELEKALGDIETEIATLEDKIEKRCRK